MTKQKIVITPEQARLMLASHLYQVMHQAQKQNRIPLEVESNHYAVKTKSGRISRMFSKSKPESEQIPEETIHKIAREYLNCENCLLPDEIVAGAYRGGYENIPGVEFLDANTCKIGNHTIKFKANLRELTSEIVYLARSINKDIEMDHVPTSLSDFINSMPAKYKSKETVKLAKDFDAICTTLHFTSPEEMERYVQDFSENGRKGFQPAAGQMLASSEAFLQGLYIEWAKEIAHTDGEKAVVNEAIHNMENHVINGRQAYNTVKEMVEARNGDATHHKVLVAETKNQISLEFYYNMQRIIDACGGFGHDPIQAIIDGKLTEIKKPDLALITGTIQGEIARLKQEIADGKSADGKIKMIGLPIVKSRNERIEELEEKLLRYQTIYSDDNLAGVNAAIKWVRDRVNGSMVDFYMIDKKDVTVRQGRTYTEDKVEVAASKYQHAFSPVVEKELMRLRKDGYVKNMLFDRLYLQNLTALSKVIGGLAGGTVGIGAIDMGSSLACAALHVPHSTAKIVESGMKVLTGGGANGFNGWADKVSGGVLLGNEFEITLDDGRKAKYRPGIVQAQQEHASKGGLAWGILGGTLFAAANAAYGLNLKDDITLAQAEKAALLHAGSGNFTTQTVGAAVLAAVYKETKLLADAGALVFDSVPPAFYRGLKALGVFKSMRNAEIFHRTVKEVYVHNIFRLWQTVRGSISLWVGIVGGLGPLKLVAQPGRAQIHPQKIWRAVVGLPLGIWMMASAYKKAAAENERENVWKQLKRSNKFKFGAIAAIASAIDGAMLAAKTALFTTFMFPLGGMALFVFAVLETPLAAIGMKIQPAINRHVVAKGISKLGEKIDSEYRFV